MKKIFVLIFGLFLFLLFFFLIFVRVGNTYEITEFNKNIMIEITCYQQDSFYEKGEIDFCLSIKKQKDNENMLMIKDVNLYDTHGNHIVPNNILSSDADRKFISGKEKLILKNNYPVIINFQRIRLPRRFNLDITIDSTGDNNLHIRKSVHRKYYLYLRLLTV